jgi:hypothetical protein
MDKWTRVEVLKVEQELGARTIETEATETTTSLGRSPRKRRKRKPTLTPSTFTQMA